MGAVALGAAAAPICVGSYNIRVLTPNDLGVHAWDARKEYVARTVMDNAMDVVGFNEVKSERQQTELKGLLPEYSFHGWDGHEACDYTGESPVDLCAWRTDKFTLVDQGYFFLGRDLERWEQPWDNSGNNVRHTSWVKLRENATGGEFYFFCTHLDHQGQVARMLQAHLNQAMVKRIAGSTPHIIVGDQNSTISRVNYLNIYNANFDDAFTVTNSAERYGNDPGTAGKWNDDPDSGRRIDYIWTDGFAVKSYDHCTETYDLGAMPSDHIAIKAMVEILDRRSDRRLYVRAGGSGDGSAEAPFGRLEDALAASFRGDTIMVGAGEYEIGKTIAVEKSVKIFGGWNGDFTKVEGLSRFRATAEVRCFSLKTATDVEMRYIGVYNGKTVNSNGDGAGVMAHGARYIARYCEFADNNAARDGGAIDVTGQLILDHVRFSRNSAGRYGGGFCADNPTKRYWFNMPVTNCIFEGNNAVDGSAIYLPRFIYGYVAGNTFSGNHATEGSTVYLHAIGTDNNLGSKLAVFNNTFVLNSAWGAGGSSALKADIEPAGTVGIICNTIVSNEGGEGSGSAVSVTSGKPYIAGNIIALNRGGDVSLAATTGISASHNIYTSASSISYTLNSRDLAWGDYAEAVAGLGRMLDGYQEGERFVPVLSQWGAEEQVASEEAGADLSLHGYVCELPEEEAKRFLAPGVAISEGTCGTYVINCLPQTRLREATVHTDFNFDCMEDGVLLSDQGGKPRPQDGTATVGARESTADSGIDGVGSDRSMSGDQEPEYFTLQGIRVKHPAAGSICIVRQGGEVRKVLVK